MRVAFFHSDKPREHILADAFLDGVRAHGDDGSKRPLDSNNSPAFDYDVACMVGVKSRELFNAHFSRGIHIVYLDKGYTRHSAPGSVRGWEYWRVAVDGHQPTPYLMKAKRPLDRMERLGLALKPWRPKARYIVIAGSSQKYHDFYGLWEPTRYWAKQIRHIAGFSQRPIKYRPKPSWKAAVPIDGTIYSQAPAETIYKALERAHVLVTHGSNACFEAVLEGVPCIILGEAVAKPISSTQLKDVDEPFLAKEKDRIRLIANLAYCQFTLPEFASGMAWSIVRPQIYG